jgi:hypothetical protein
MKNDFILPNFTMAELVFQVYNSRLLTKEDRKQLRNFLLACKLTDEDTKAVNRLLHGVRRGWLKLADQ